MYPKNQKAKIFLIHHTHTDIGYTDRQEKIERYHIDFIKQAVEISELILRGEKPEWKGFSWTCENFWGVEKFLEWAQPELKGKFINAVKAGIIEITGNYLNLNELIDYDILKSRLKKAVDFGKSIDVEIDCAMTADVNGYGWGYARAFYETGIKNFFTCIHTHHGMYPLWRKQIPFFWETGSGDRILVWSGDHYHLGNVLGFAPPTITEGKRTKAILSGDLIKEAKKIFNYLSELKESGYPYDFVPIMVSGVVTDNAPPNPHIMDFINHWNELYGESVYVEMATLKKFFQIVRKEVQNIPVYRGDWPDWWSDGVGSTPWQVKLFREAQRTLKQIKRLNEDINGVKNDEIDKIENDLILYAEHTWGHSASVTEPWAPIVKNLEFRKDFYAIRAHQLAYKVLDDIFRLKGEAELYPGRPLRFKVLNPFPFEVKEIVSLYLDYWERWQVAEGFEVIEEKSAKRIDSQSEDVSRGTEVKIPVDLKGHEEKVFIIRPVKNDTTKIKSYHFDTADGVRDIKPKDFKKEVFINNHQIENSFVRITWKEREGIISWFDKVRGKELLRGDRLYQAFTPIYEITPQSGHDNVWAKRNSMGRNRKGRNVIRSTGRLNNVRIIDEGPLLAKILLNYEVQGCKDFSLVLTVYNNMPRVDVNVRINKDNIWDPENLYLALPFTINDEGIEELWVEKTGALVRPRKDQIPGTAKDFYCIQEGLALVGNNLGLIIAVPDTPLIHIGSLEHGEIELFEENENFADYQLYSWVMNNFWETNFKASLGDFYEFNYIVMWGEDLKDPKKAIEKCHVVNNGVYSFRSR